MKKTSTFFYLLSFILVLIYFDASAQCEDFGAELFVINNPLCDYSQDGSMSVTITGGTAPYTYSWGPIVSGSDATITGIARGFISCTVTDDNGCSVTPSMELTAPAAIENSYTQTNTTCPDSEDGSISVTTTGGTTPYFYSWPDGTTTSNNSGLAAGFYPITVTDVNGCQSQIELIVEIPSIPTLNAYLVPMFPSCEGYSDAKAFPEYLEGGTPPYTFAWPGYAETSDTLRGLSTGDVISCVIKDSHQCSIEVTGQVVGYSYVRASISSISQVGCMGGSTGSMQGEGAEGFPPYQLEWIDHPGSSLLEHVPAGTYTLRVTDAHHCVDEQPFVIIENLFEIFTSSKPDTCSAQNGIAIVSATGATGPFTYLWTDSGETNDSLINVLSGDYQCVVTDSKGCSAEPVTVTVDEEICTDVAQNSASDGIVCFPNPTTDQLHISSPDVIEEVKLYNGEGVMQNIRFYQETLDLKGYNKGIYIIQLRTSKGTYQKKIQLQ